jgi:transmembrane sensor
MTKDRRLYLIEQFIRHACTPEERQELAEWIDGSEDDAVLQQVLADAWSRFSPDEKMPSYKADALLSEILESEGDRGPMRPSPPVTRLWKRIAVAATIVLALGMGSYWIVFRQPRKETAKAVDVPGRPKQPVQDVSPGRVGAVLTLSNGAKILLDTATGHMLARQGNTQVLNKDGQLTYSRPTEPAAEVLFNTLSTNRGEQYPLTLSDGTRVWLNASSSIRFPVVFTGGDRTVEITGEAYFEVAENKNKPFRVKYNDEVVDVLGTHFDVMAYEDEPVSRTTLAEGSVRVSRNDQKEILRPGQQAVTGRSGKAFSIVQANLEEALAWKDGYFVFRNENIQSIMRQASRWYDIDVAYEGDVRRLSFGGRVSRFRNISELLNNLELTGTVHFKIEGKKVTVME